VSSYIDTPRRTYPKALRSQCWGDTAFERLRWRHGDVRALEIARGRDEDTKKDISAWRALGRRA